MGPKNKGCVTRRTEILQTPISSILNGHLRSRIYRAGDKSTDNIQPFFTLQLNIEVRVCTFVIVLLKNWTGGIILESVYSTRSSRSSHK